MTRHLSEAERRTQILRAARATFIERGYLSARVEDVARRAKLSKGAVYFYFRSKRELFDALMDEEHAVALDFLHAAEADPRPAAVRIFEVGTRYLDHFAGHKSPPRFFLLMSEMAIRDEQVRERLTQMHERFLAQIARLIDAGVAEGSFRACDSAAAAMVLKAMVDGLSGQSAIGIRPDVARLSSEGVRLLMVGLSAQGELT